MLERKELKRIDWDTVKRLVSLLYYENKIKKTNLAMKCNMSYDNCVLYLDWMEVFDLIKREIDDNGFELISLDARGHDLYQKKFREVSNYVQLN